MDTELAYNQALDYLYAHVDYSLKKSSELAKAHFDLGRMRQLMALLGNPQETYPTLHVAGTKGKGSTCALMASALRAAGYRTGLYISPHLQDFTERIQVDGEPVTHAGLVDLVEQVKPFVEQVPQVTTFEIATALAFLYFARQKVDAAVIEVGLGGRLDATNILTPRVSVITSLSYDHMAVLGNTLTAIAGEKAGILKSGVPVVSAPQVDEALAVVEKVSAEKQAPLTLVGREVIYQAGEHSLDGQSMTVAGKDSPAAKPVILHLPLLGERQLVNAATAYAALKASRLDISEEDIREGFASVSWPCRFEVVRRQPPVVIDSAHNAESARHLRQALDDYFPGYPVIWVFAILEDKDAAGMLAELSPRLTRIVATRADHPRALEAEKIVDLARQSGVPVETAESSSAALRRALELAGSNGLVLSAGSVAFAGEMKTAWQKLNS